MGSDLTIHVSVVDIAEALAADRRADSISVPMRGKLGQQAHRRFLSRFDQQDVELTIRQSYRTACGVTLELAGRIDAAVRRTDEIEITEYKSVVWSPGGLGIFHDQPPDRFVIQAMLYAWLAESKSRRKDVNRDYKVRCLVVIENLADGEQREFDIPWSKGDVETLLDRFAESWLSKERLQASEQGRRESAAKRMTWPYDSYRPCQTEIRAEISKSFSEGGDILLNAPPGIGKTMAVLFPALRESLEQGRQLFFATAKGGGRRPVIRALEIIIESTPEIRAMILPAAAELCLIDQTNDPDLHCDACQYMPAPEPDITTEAIFERGMVTTDALIDTGKSCGVCPFQMSRRLVELADVVVGDYNFVFDWGVRLPHFRDRQSAEWNLVVDEAHNLFSRVCDMYSLRIDLIDMLGWIKLIELELRLWPELRFTDEDTAALQHVRSMLEEILEIIPETGFEEIDLELCFRPGISESFGLMTAKILLEIGSRLDDEVSKSLWQVYNMLRRLEELIRFDREVFPTFGEEGRRLVILCLDPSEICRGIFGEFGSVAAFSGTFNPIAFYRGALGFGGRPLKEIDLVEPGLAQRRKIVLAPGVDTRYKLRPKQAERIAGLILEFAGIHAGGYIAVFPSFKFAEMVTKFLTEDGIRLAVQTQGMSAARRDEMRKMLGGIDNTSLAVVVAGGQFTEADDHPGNSCVGIAIVGPCLPPPTPDRELLRSYWDRRGEDGFGVAYVQPGIRRVVQAAGRLIRNENDRGVILLIDDRFTQQPYLGLLPDDWQRDIASVSGDWSERVRRFWSNDG